MREIARSHTPIAVLSFAFSALVLVSCRGPFVWNADLRSFVDDGVATVTVTGYTVESGGVDRKVIPSRVAAVVTLDLDNPRTLKLIGTVHAEDESLFDSPPVAAVLSPAKTAISFTPSLGAERKDLVFDVGFTAPGQNRSYGPVRVTIFCNTAPGSVESTLDAALNASGYAFTAFRLPDGPTDDDLSEVEISYRRADGTGTAVTAKLPVGDRSLLAKELTADGRDLLGDGDALDRYFRPPGISSGDDYLFEVVVIDSEGMRSAPAEATSNATLYSVTYNGNGSTGGSAPVDASTYRQTKPVTVLGPGTLERTGYSFAGWNTGSDGTGTAYAAGESFRIGAGSVTLYAQWSADSYTVSFDSRGGAYVQPETGAYGSSLTLPDGPARAGYRFVGWSDTVDGPGSVYAPGAGFTVPANDVVLYALWKEIPVVSVAFSLPEYRSLAFTYEGAMVTTLTLPRSAEPLEIAYGDADPATHGWTWYVDGVDQGVDAGSLLLDISRNGRYVVSCTADYGGVRYAGSLTVTVTSPPAVSRNEKRSDPGAASSAAAPASVGSEELATGPSHPFSGWPPLAARRGAKPRPAGEPDIEEAPL